MKRRRHSFSAHAQTVTHERGIEHSWIERTLEAPDQVESDKSDPRLKHYLARIAEYDGRVLRVIARASDDSVHVITAYFDRALRGKL